MKLDDMLPHPRTLTYRQRADLAPNATARALFAIMDKKHSNLALAADVSTKAELLHVADVVGPYICCLKTHVDIIVDFDTELVRRLSDLAKKHEFLIFEDRKFADIGNTVRMQYNDGIYQIAAWSHLTNAHPIPGPGLIDGLKSVGLPLQRGLLLVAEMSSAGGLTSADYVRQTLEMARHHRDFVIGFISQRCLSSDPADSAWIYMSPGVKLVKAADDIGQRYDTPRDVICKRGSDIIIVGRGIYESKSPAMEAEIYRKVGWDAYLESFAVN